MKTIKLDQIITVANLEVSQLDFEPMKAKHIMSMTTDPGMRDMFKIASSLCNQPLKVLEELSIKDTAKVMEHVGNELAPFQGTQNP